MDFFIGGLSSAIAVVFSNPFEVVRTRMQLQGELKARGQYHVTYRNIFHAFYTVGKVDGVLAYQKGLTPAFAYNLVLNCIRRGMYQEIVDDTYMSSTFANHPNSLRFIGAWIGGAVSAGMTSPFFLVKTHLQSKAHKDIAVGYQHKHTGVVQAFRTIFKEHGLRGLYRGASANVLRVGFGSAAEITSFMYAKQKLAEHNIYAEKSFGNIFVGSMVGSVAVVGAMTPFDVIAVRFYNQGLDKHGKGLLYKNVFDCMQKILKEEGPFGFYKGITAALLRIAPQVGISLVLWDELRIYYRKYLDSHETKSDC